MSKEAPSAEPAMKAQANREMLQQRKRLIRRQSLLEKIATLATELCTAVDRESEDIGGSRKSLTILQELGPVCDDLERWAKSVDPADVVCAAVSSNDGELERLRAGIKALQTRCCGSDDLCNGCRALLTLLKVSA